VLGCEKNGIRGRIQVALTISMRLSGSANVGVVLQVLKGLGNKFWHSLLFLNSYVEFCAAVYAESSLARKESAIIE
jgi:hypothetical protein